MVPLRLSCFILILLTILMKQCESSYNHYLPSKYYYTPPSTYYKDDNVYITDKYGNTVAVEPYWSRSAKSYDYNRKCYNCVPYYTSSAKNYYNYDPYYDYPYYRKVYVKDQYGNSVLVNPYYVSSSDAYWRKYYYPRTSRYYSTARSSSSRSSSSHEDYVYINDMYGRTRAVPKSNYLYEYAKGY